MKRGFMKGIGGLLGLALIVSGWGLWTEPARSDGATNVDVSNQVKVTFSGLSLNRTTQTYDTTATLTNTSSDPILAPLELHIVRITPATVTFANPTGTAGDGDLFIAVPLPTGTLAPGATVTNVVLRFRNPNKVQFTFGHHVIGTQAARNKPPVANAGPDQSAKVNATVTLDGSASTDPDGDALTYLWTLPTVPAGSVATLTAPTTVHPTLTLDKPGAYAAQLVVHDGTVDSAPDTVTISTENTPPVANAGRDQRAPIGATVTLDGSASTDVDGHALTYQWTLPTRPEGSAAVLANPATVQPTLTLDKAGTYTVQLVVNDGTVDSAPASVTISTENTKPVAKAGPDQSVAVGAKVTLNGADSRDADGDALTYQWALTTQPVRSAATLANPTTVNPSFTADQAGDYVAQLIVNDGKTVSDPDTVRISTENSKPVADAGPDQAVKTGQTVTLDGSASRDADGDPLTYQWSLTTRPVQSQATVQNAAGVQATLTPDLVGDYIAQLIVSDGIVSSLPDTARITVTAAAPTNHPPKITSTPVTATTVGQPYRYDVDATDPDPGDVLNYLLSTKPDGMTLDATTGLIQWTPPAAGGANVSVQAKDAGGLTDSQSFTITVAAAAPTNQAPQVSVSAHLTTITLPTNGVALAGTVTDDGLPNPPAKLTLAWSQDSGPAGVIFANAASATTTATFPGAGAYGLRLTANDGDLSAFATVTVTVNPEPQTPLPPDPATVAPPVDPTVATTTYAATQFLYSGSNPIQTLSIPHILIPRTAALI